MQIAYHKHVMNPNEVPLIIPEWHFVLHFAALKRPFMTRKKRLIFMANVARPNDSWTDSLESIFGHDSF